MPIFKPPPDDENPSANIFGWKISIIGLVVMLLLGIIVAYRTITLDVPLGFEDPLKQPESKNYYRDKADREAATADSIRRSKQ